MPCIRLGYVKRSDNPSVYFVGAPQPPSQGGQLSVSRVHAEAAELVEEFDIAAESDSYFDDSSLSKEAQPRIIILMGGTGAGKTRRRKKLYSTGYVLVDAADIFIKLSRGAYLPFPKALQTPMVAIGILVARRAVEERRHIVTEIIGADFDPTKGLIDAMGAIGYDVKLDYVSCDIQEAWNNNVNRGDDNISCYYAEPFQRTWLLEAAALAADKLAATENPQTPDP